MVQCDYLRLKRFHRIKEGLPMRKKPASLRGRLVLISPLSSRLTFVFPYYSGAKRNRQFPPE